MAITLTPEQIKDLKDSQKRLNELERDMVNMQAALIPIPADVKASHEDLKKRISALLAVYGK